MFKGKGMLAKLALVMAMALLLTACGNPGATTPAQSAAPGAQPDTQPGATAPAAESGKKIRLGLVIADLSNSFWGTLKEGAEAAAAAEGVELTVLASKNLEENVKATEDMIQTKVDAIGLAAFDAKGNIPVVEQANAAGIPVFTVDSNVDGGEIVSYIGTDNVLGGELAAEWIANKIEGKGKVAIIEGTPGYSTNTLRLEGFHKVMDTYSGIEIVASVPGNWMIDQGMKAMSDILAGNPDISAVMVMSDNMALGALEALKAANRTDIALVGYNGANEALNCVYTGEFAADVVQYPEEMGRLYVESAVKLIRDGIAPTEKHIKPPVHVLDTQTAQKAMSAITGQPPVYAKTSSVKADKPYRLGLVIADLSNSFWGTLKAGAEAAAAATGVELTVLASKNLEENVKATEDMIQTKVDAIGLAAFDAKGNIPVVEQANAAGIPVFTVDSNVDGGKVVTYIGTDNVLGGELAAEWMANKIGRKGKVAIIEGTPGYSTNTLRLEGFHKVMDTYPDIQIVASVPGNWMIDQGMKAMSDILAGNPDISAVMVMSDNMALGALEALKAANRTDIALVGYNGAVEAINCVYKGEFSADVVQYPEEMGRLYVEWAVRTLQGNPPDSAHIKPPLQVMDSVFLAKLAKAVLH